MSSPTKQVSARRLPPLPNQNPGGKLIIRSPKTVTDVEEREALFGISSSSSPRTSSSHDNKRKLITGLNFSFIVTAVVCLLSKHRKR